MASTPRRRAPRLNHVAISMAPGALDDRCRAEIEAFYGEVFEWYSHPNEYPPGMFDD